MILSEIECAEAQSLKKYKICNSSNSYRSQKKDTFDQFRSVWKSKITLTHTEDMPLISLGDVEKDKIFSNSQIFIRQDKMEKEIVRLFEDIFLRESH